MFERLGRRRLTEELSDAALHRAALQGNEEAIATLYRRHGGLVYRFTLRMSRDAAMAEEITQEVFLALLRQLERFDPQRGALSTWLCGIARRQLWKHFEQGAGMASLEDEAGALEVESEDESPMGSLLRREAVASLWAAVETLPVELREVIVLCALEEMSYEQVAEVLAVPVGTVRSRLHRAKARLKAVLRNEMAGTGDERKCP